MIDNLVIKQRLVEVLTYKLEDFRVHKLDSKYHKFKPSVDFYNNEITIKLDNLTLVTMS